MEISILPEGDDRTNDTHAARVDTFKRLVQSHLEGFPRIEDLPDLSDVYGFVTGPVWIGASGRDVVAREVLLGVIDRIESVDQLRILSDRGYLTRDNYRDAWALLLGEGVVRQTELVPEDAVWSLRSLRPKGASVCGLAELSRIHSDGRTFKTARCIIAILRQGEGSDRRH